MVMEKLHKKESSKKGTDDKIFDDPAEQENKINQKENKMCWERGNKQKLSAREA